MLYVESVVCCMESVQCVVWSQISVLYGVSLVLFGDSVVCCMGSMYCVVWSQCSVL